MDKLIMPSRQGAAEKEELADVRSVVIVGPNGAGKSRLGYWIENNQGETPVHRVAAQRSLVIEEYIQPRPYARAVGRLYYGTDDPRYHDKANRWGGDPSAAISMLLNDYEAVLGLLFASENKRNRDYADKMKASKQREEVPDSPLDRLQRIWKKIMPHRDLVVGEDSLQARTANGKPYSARQMSDGERVAFYLIGQSLCAPENAIVVIDEPEIHLHRAIQAQLWDEIEAARTDCIFVYITHDLDFAATRATAHKILVKEYDGQNWKWDDVPSLDVLPEDVLLQILGSRKPVLFIEGADSSLDIAIFRSLFPERLVIPRGSCEKVSDATKTLRGLPSFHHLAPCGLIDRDYRTDEELNALKQDGVHAADVAEIENLFCVPEVVELVAKDLHMDPAATRIKVEEFVLNRLANELDTQVIERTEKEVAFRLGGFSCKKKAIADLVQEVDRFYNGIKVGVQNIHGENQKLFEDIVKTKAYASALRCYNRKSMACQISACFGLKSGEYVKLILRRLKEDQGKPLLDAMRKYLPPLS